MGQTTEGHDCCIVQMGSEEGSLQRGCTKSVYVLHAVRTVKTCLVQHSRPWQRVERLLLRAIGHVHLPTSRPVGQGSFRPYAGGSRPYAGLA
jgi:hypothetical protein